MTGVIVIPEGAHSILGPSSADRWLNCPGSVLLPGPSPQTEYAAEGTAAHTLSEWVRNSGKPAEAWKGKTLQVGGYQFKIGKSFINSVNRFVEDAAKEGSGPALVEERVHYEEVVAGGFGTLDHARLADWLCRVKDFKHGKGVIVGAKMNAQLMLYAFGVWLKYRWLFDFDRFLLSICQPRVHHFDEWEISLGHLLQWVYDVVRPGAVKALTPGSEIKAGPWCKFCKAKDTCDVRARYKVGHETGTWERPPRDADEELVTLEEE